MTPFSSWGGRNWMTRKLWITPCWVSAAPLCSELLGTHSTALAALLLHSHQHQPRVVEGSRSPGDMTIHHRSERIPAYTHPLHGEVWGAKWWEGALRKTAEDPRSTVKVNMWELECFQQSLAIAVPPPTPALAQVIYAKQSAVSWEPFGCSCPESKALELSIPPLEAIQEKIFVLNTTLI